MDEEARNKLKNEKGPADNPPNSYNPQPKQAGLIIWISGMRKTTTARLLQEKKGFVNYKGDCFLMGLNPIICFEVPFIRIELMTSLFMVLLVKTD